MIEKERLIRLLEDTVLTIPDIPLDVITQIEDIWLAEFIVFVGWFFENVMTGIRKTGSLIVTLVTFRDPAVDIGELIIDSDGVLDFSRLSVYVNVCHSLK